MRLLRLLVLLAPFVTACTSLPRVGVTLTPDVPMSSVTINGRPATRTTLAGDAVGVERVAWVAAVDLTGRSSVDVEAKAKGGVVATSTFPVGSPPRDPEIVGPLPIPAAIDFQVVTKHGAPRLMVDGETLTLTDGKVRWQDASAKREVAVVAHSSANECRLVVKPEPGVLRTEKLVVDPTASFVITPTREPAQHGASNGGPNGASSGGGGTNHGGDVWFGEEVVFDASTSSPDDLRQYLWDFGDGTKTATDEKRITHTFHLADGTRSRESYKVTLQVRGESAVSETFSRDVEVVIGRKQLEVDLQTFPSSAATFQPGSKVLFRLVARPGCLPNDVDTVSVEFGEGPPTTVDVDGIPITGSIASARGTPVLVAHTYTKAGRFRPKVTYTHRTPSLQGPFTATLFRGEARDPDILIAPQPRTERELAEAAWVEAEARLVEALAAAKVPKDARIALTALRDANFDGKDLPETRAIDRLTAALVGAGYVVLERTASALSRLAPEAVVDIRPELETGKTTAPDAAPSYRANLDYGLRVAHHPEQPIQYSIALEGVADRVTHLTQQAGAEATPSGQLAKNLPVLVARFATAQHVIALEVQSGAAGGGGPRTAGAAGAPPAPVLDADVTVTPPDYYDAALDVPAVRRTATVRLLARILDRDGSIRRIAPIVGQATDQVPQLDGARGMPAPAPAPAESVPPPAGPPSTEPQAQPQAAATGPSIRRG